jgi:hypothetical protein
MRLFSRLESRSLSHPVSSARTRKVENKSTYWSRWTELPVHFHNSNKFCFILLIYALLFILCFDPKNGGKIFLQGTGELEPYYITSHPKDIILICIQLKKINMGKINSGDETERRKVQQELER